MIIRKRHDIFKERLMRIIEEVHGNKFSVFSEFLLNYQQEEYPSNPQRLETYIKDIGERAFSRAIFKEEEISLSSNIGEKTVFQILDIELPVVLNRNSTRKRIDLIGHGSEGLTICELKFAKGEYFGDCPEYALFELLNYCYLIQVNYKLLDKHMIHHKTEREDFLWSDFVEKQPYSLMLVANKQYWDHWLNDSSEQSFKELLRVVSQKLCVKVSCYVAADENFEKQRGDCSKYSPSLKNKVWNQLF